MIMGHVLRHIGLLHRYMAIGILAMLVKESEGETYTINMHTKIIIQGEKSVHT